MPMGNHKMNINEPRGEKRVSIVAGLLLIQVLLFACFPISANAEPIKKIYFLTMWFPQPQFAGYYMAKEKGIYKKYGLDVTILKYDRSKDVSTSLSQGKIQFGIMNLLTAIEKREKGLKLVNVGQVFQRSAIEFVARKDSGIHTPQDFNGKKIAVWRSVLRAQTHGFMEKFGIQADIYPVGQVITFFLKRAVDIIPVMHYNEYNTLINHGINPDELTLFKLGQFNMDFPEDGIYCLAGTYRADPKLAQRFVKASMEGWDYAIEHPAETIAVIEKIRLNAHLITNRAHLQWMMGDMPAMLRPKDKNAPMGHLSKTDYEHAVDFLFQTHAISKKVSYDAFCFNR
jgi:NitT/TauT family transport system substrate-binding protein